MEPQQQTTKGRGMRVAETIVAAAMGALLVVRLILSLTGVVPGFLNSPVDVAIYTLFSALCVLMGVEQAKRGQPKRAVACFIGAAAWTVFAVLILR